MNDLRGMENRISSTDQRELTAFAVIENRLSQIFVPLLFLLLIPTLLLAQHRTIDWKLLSKVEWSEKYSKEHDEMFYYPKFGKEVLAMNGQLVQIKGYVIPVDVETGYFVLSANPFASCFFCGQAGPESILELQLKEGGKKLPSPASIPSSSVSR